MTLKGYRNKSKVFWTKFRFKYIGKIRPYLNENKMYINTNITRPYICYKDKSKSYERFEKLKKIWENRDIVIIEGKMTKIGIENDLLDKCKSVKRIIYPSKNAFDKYNEILKATKK